MHEEELFKMCVSSLISWCKLFCEVTTSILLPSLLVIIWTYQMLDLALKSPRETIKKGFFWARVSKVNSKLSRDDAESSYDWLGDL